MSYPFNITVAWNKYVYADIQRGYTIMYVCNINFNSFVRFYAIWIIHFERIYKQNVKGNLIKCSVKQFTTLQW